MTNIDLELLISMVFEKAYLLGKNDGLEGVHFCPKEQYNQFIEKMDFPSTDEN